MVYRTGCLRELPKISRAKSNKEFLIAMASALLTSFYHNLFPEQSFSVESPLCPFHLPPSPFPFPRPL
jgi:hypothetical protein